MYLFMECTVEKRVLISQKEIWDMTSHLIQDVCFRLTTREHLDLPLIQILKISLLFLYICIEQTNVVLAKIQDLSWFLHLVNYFFKINQYFFYSTLILLVIWKHSWRISCTERGISVVIREGSVIIHFEMQKDFSKTHNSVMSCND